MAEVCFSGSGRPTTAAAVRVSHNLQPLGDGLAGVQELRTKPARPASAGGRHAPAWGAGPGGGGHSPGVSPRVDDAQGLRHKQVAQFHGAAVAATLQFQQQAAADRSVLVTKQVAGPYQKDAAIRSAERAIRPWSPYVGLGERRGAQFGELLAQSLTHPADPNAPTAFLPPNTAYATAVGSAAKQIARPGSGQMSAPGAWSPVPGQPARELWPVDLQQQPLKYCAGCRGEHESSKEDSHTWEPYSPAQRLANLNALASTFQAALLKGQLCVALNESRIQPVRWTWTAKDHEGDTVNVQPGNMSKQDFIKQLSLMFEGLREGHEPYRHLATQAVTAFCDTGSPALAAAVPSLIRPLRLALQTYEPSLVGHALLLLQRLIRSHRRVGVALVPFLSKLLPIMALFRKKHFTVHLPPPFCVSSAGSFTGSGRAPEAGGRKCKVCGCPLDKEHDSALRRETQIKMAFDNPHLLNDEPPPSPYSRHPLQGRWSKKYDLTDVINTTIDAFIESGGQDALKIVMGFVPAYSYHNPQ